MFGIRRNKHRTPLLNTTDHTIDDDIALSVQDMVNLRLGVSVGAEVAGFGWAGGYSGGEVCGLGFWGGD
jgi:hypothetical protein